MGKRSKSWLAPVSILVVVATATIITAVTGNLSHWVPVVAAVVVFLGVTKVVK